MEACFAPASIAIGIEEDALAGDGGVELSKAAEVSMDDGLVEVGPQRLDRLDPHKASTELVLLRVRVTALENLLIAVLVEGSDWQRQAARDMADAISPRAGSTQHPPTIRAAQHMTDLVDRAIRARTAPP